MGRMGRRHAFVTVAIMTIAVTAACSASAEPEVHHGVAMPAFNKDGYATEQSDAFLAEIQHAGAGWVQIVPIWYQSAAASTEIMPTGRVADTPQMTSPRSSR
jgi:hypothetical protein